MEVATHRGDGVGPAARHDMEERLFFDRIHVFGAEFAVDQAVKDAPTILADGTVAARSVTDQAAESAQAAAYLPAALLFVKHGLFHGFLPLCICRKEYISLHSIINNPPRPR
jgi:hypothetical protein